MRVTVLLIILATVAVAAWQDTRATRWRQPLFVAIYPIAADHSAVTLAYVRALDSDRLQAIDRFFEREAARHRLPLGEPIRSRLQPEIADEPPARTVPGMFATAYWSLRLRYWAWAKTRRATEPADIRLFVLYHDPASSPTLSHSLALAKGLIGVVNAFAAPTMEGANEVVMAHELLHTLGATDKYDLETNAPRYPDGYGDPHQTPLYPQRFAELMAGRRMLSAARWEQAASLDEVTIGTVTAREIHWPQATD